MPALVLCQQADRWILQAQPPSEDRPPTFARIPTGTAVAPSSLMTQQPDEDDVIVYECLDAWEIRIGNEVHGRRS